MNNISDGFHRIWDWQQTHHNFNYWEWFTKIFRSYFWFLQTVHEKVSYLKARLIFLLSSWLVSLLHTSFSKQGNRTRHILAWIILVRISYTGTFFWEKKKVTASLLMVTLSRKHPRMGLARWLLEALAELRAFCVTWLGICKVENGDFWRGGESFTKVIRLSLSPALFTALRKSKPQDWTSTIQAGCYLNVAWARLSG